MSMKSASFFLCLATMMLVTAQPTLCFTCNTTSTCHSLIDYVSPNATTLSSIKTLFGVEDVYDLLGANSLPLNTTGNYSVSAKSTIKIPFPCTCSNNTGVSNHVPVYTVQPGDGLDHIARDVFANLLKYQEIVRVNNIKDENKIDIGQELWIPLPCSCDKVNGSQVVHYGHVVKEGSSVGEIAAKYGTTEELLLKLNGMADAKLLEAGVLLDVPLPVCTSAVNNTSTDYPLVVPKDTYTLTASNCVQCKCGISTNSSSLQCVPAAIELNTTDSSQCPAMECGNGLSLGNTTSTDRCNSVCSYAGYSNKKILTTLVADPICAANAPGNYATTISMRGSYWSLVLASMYLGLLSFGFF